MIQMKTIALTALLAGCALLTGCRTAAGTGSLIGAGAGAAIGRAIGNHNHHAGAGTIAGAAIGGLTGFILGNEVDERNREYSGRGRYRGDPRYEPGYDDGYYPERRERAPRYREEYYDDGPPRERIIYRERIYYEGDCRPCW